jgi:pimeloyl-ACP methyl ester carboxylesterase
LIRGYELRKGLITPYNPDVSKSIGSNHVRRDLAPGLLILLCVAMISWACREGEGVATAPRLALEPCPAADGIEDGLCGSLEVFEDREAAAGRTIALRVVVLPALSGASLPDPLFLLAGGPGQAASELTEESRSVFWDINRTRDLVFVDQRGTGASNPLACELETDAPDEMLLLDPMEDELLRARTIERLQACLAEFDADPRFYVTPIAMDDLDDVRDALGYETINLWGGSYGTRAGLVYLRRHPAHVRAAIFDGLAPVEMKLPLYMGIDATRALDLLVVDCAADPGCSRAYPGLGAQLQALLDDLEQGPVRETIDDPRTGNPIEVVVSRTGLASMIRASLYSSELAVLVPLAVFRAAKGDYGPLAALWASVFESVHLNLNVGMFLSVVCSEDVPAITAADRELAAADPFFGTRLLDSLGALCEVWPRGELPDHYGDPVEFDGPVLLLSGFLDPVTPPRWAAKVGVSLTNAREIVVPGVGHGTIGIGCIPKLMSQFIEQGTASGLDVRCVEEIERPRFFDSTLGPGTAGGGPHD